MKPGNLSERRRCQIRRQTKDEGSIQRTSNLRCAVFLFGSQASLLVLACLIFLRESYCDV